MRTASEEPYYVAIVTAYRLLFGEPNPTQLPDELLFQVLRSQRSGELHPALREEICQIGLEPPFEYRIPGIEGEIRAMAELQRSAPSVACA